MEKNSYTIGITMILVLASYIGNVKASDHVQKYAFENFRGEAKTGQMATCSDKIMIALERAMYKKTELTHYHLGKGYIIAASDNGHNMPKVELIVQAYSIFLNRAETLHVNGVCDNVEKEIDYNFKILNPRASEYYTSIPDWVMNHEYAVPNDVYTTEYMQTDDFKELTEQMKKLNN